MPNSNDDINTYLIKSSFAREMARLYQQDSILNETMQSLLPTHLYPNDICSVLDLACGSGGWALRVAEKYPHIQVTGVDINQIMVDHANTRVEDLQLPNCHFERRTAFLSTTVPSIHDMTERFDFINMRFAMAFMLYDEWIPLIEWCYAHLNPRGWLRLTEQGQYAHVNGGGLAEWFVLLSKGLVLRKMLEAETGSITLILDDWMEQVGFKNLQETCYLLNFSAGRKQHQSMVDDWMTATELLIPFLVSQRLGEKEELEQLREQLLQEMNAPTFKAHIYLPSFSGQKL